MYYKYKINARLFCSHTKYSILFYKKKYIKKIGTARGSEKTRNSL